MQNNSSTPLWAVAYCGFAVFAISIFMGVAGHLDPAILAMH
jgi:hypothetical protein